jgi:hypothetical protein
MRIELHNPFPEEKFRLELTLGAFGKVKVEFVVHPEISPFNFCPSEIYSTKQSR